MVMARTQTLVQLTEGLLALLDERAGRDRVSRSELIRRAVEAYLIADADAAIDRAIVDGYMRRPAPEPDAETLARAIASIDEEAW